MPEKPIPVIFRSLRLLLTGKLFFNQVLVGQTIVRADGRAFRIFRGVRVRVAPGTPPPGGLFCVWFYARTSQRATIRLSRFMMVFFLGMRGFRAKAWMVDPQTGEFGGVYEWETLEQAQGYASSFAMRLSSLRAVPGRFRTEVYAMDDPRAAIAGQVRTRETAPETGQ